MWSGGLAASPRGPGGEAAHPLSEWVCVSGAPEGRCAMPSSSAPGFNFPKTNILLQNSLPLLPVIKSATVPNTIYYPPQVRSS